MSAAARRWIEGIRLGLARLASGRGVSGSPGGRAATGAQGTSHLFSRSTRSELAEAHLSGSGLEIGALHSPLPVPPGIEVRYVDYLTRRELLDLYPDVDPALIVEPHIIDDGFSLSTLPQESADFVIANHVIEHGNDPLGTLEIWCRILRPGGTLIAAAPLAEKCFDRGRPLTSLDHLIEDRRLHLVQDKAQMADRDRAHLVEWYQISIPNMSRGTELPYYVPGDEEVDRIIGDADPSESSIHFHTFSAESYLKMMEHVCRDLVPAMHIVEFVPSSGGECIVALRKADGP